MTKTLMIQGTSSGVGKTTLVTALCRIFSNRGYSIAPFKSQNMSNYSYKNGFEISQAQAIQAIAARADITPHMNPILLKPLGNYISNVVIQGKLYKKMSAKNYYEKFALHQGIKIAMDSFDNLKSQYDLIILEGAGSPAEINLQKYDIANMKIAEKTNSPVLLVTDIEKGGSFASLVGTISLLPKNHQKMVKGFVINKFRGNKALLQPGFRKLKQITSKSVFGVIPVVDLELPNEDSLDNKIRLFRKQNQKRLDVQIDKLASIVQKNLNIKSIEGLIQ
jgi:adenosylcobyric acid synthase